MSVSPASSRPQSPHKEPPVTFSVGAGICCDNPVIESLARAITIEISLHSIQCFDVGLRRNSHHTTVNRKDVRSRTKWIQSSSIYVPIIDLSMFLQEESMLEFYYALRSCILYGHPTIVPVLEKDLLLVCSELTRLEEAQKQGESLSPSPSVTPGRSSDDKQLRILANKLFNSAAARQITMVVPWICEACCFLTSDTPSAEIAVRLVNFAREVGYHLPDATAGSGKPLLVMYETSFAKHSNAKPNSGVLAILRQLKGKLEIRALTSLTLKNLLMGDIGCIALSDVIGMIPCVQVVDLEGNGITDKGTHAICQALVPHPSLRQLNLNDNRIGNAGASDVYFLIREHPLLASATLEGNAIFSTVWLRRIQQALVANAEEAARMLARSREFDEMLGSDPLLHTLGYSTGLLLRGFLGVPKMYQNSDLPLLQLTLSTSHDKRSAHVLCKCFSNHSPDELPITFETLIPSSEETLIDAVQRYIKEFVSTNALSITRQNETSMQVVVDSGETHPPPASVGMPVKAPVEITRKLSEPKVSVNTPQPASVAGPHKGRPPGAKRVLMLYLHTLAELDNPLGVRLRSFGKDQRLVQIVLRISTKQRSSTNNAQSLTMSENDKLDSASEKQDVNTFFTESRYILYFGIAAHGKTSLRVVTRSFVQLFRQQISTSSGNFGDEIRALLQRVLRQQLESGERGAAAQGNDGNGLQQLRDDDQRDEREEQQDEAAQERNVLTMWNRVPQH